MKGSFKRERIINEIEEVDKILDCIPKYGLKVLKIGKDGEYNSLEEAMIRGEYNTLSDLMIIEVSMTKLRLTTKYYEGKATTYVFDLNLDDHSNALKGQQAFAQFQKYFKVPKASDYNIPDLDRWLDQERGTYACTARPILGYNSKYNLQEIHNAYEYDLNSAYSSALMDRVIDLKAPVGLNTIVGPNQVGFLLNEELTMIDPGYEADVVFNEIESPADLKKFCKKYYKLKQESTGSVKQQAKGMLNFPIGYCQRVNPFFRAYVVHKCNRVIKELIDDDTLCWNTDAIFSTKKLDLNIGMGIGQFKEINFSTFRMNGNTYQIDDEIPVYRGIPKAYFKRFEYTHGRPFNILTDTLDERLCLYSFNFNTLKLEDNYDKER